MFLDKINYREFLVVFGSVEIGAAIRGEEATAMDAVIENLIYSTMFTILKDKYPNKVGTEDDLKFYVMGFVKSAISEGTAELINSAIASGDKPKIKRVLKDALIKYVEVIIGHIILDNFFDYEAGNGGYGHDLGV